MDKPGRKLGATFAMTMLKSRNYDNCLMPQQKAKGVTGGLGCGSDTVRRVTVFVKQESCAIRNIRSGKLA